MNVLVTGGAGYIGSHMVYTLIEAGHQVIVLDDLSAGRRETVHPDAKFVEGDVRDRDLVLSLLCNSHIEAVLHFASRIQVGESVTNPRLYYRDNLAAGIQLLESVIEADVKYFILSSTAAVYGTPQYTPIDEEHPTHPVNPYGDTKLALEHMLVAYAKAYGLRYTALRYFNAAGAEPNWPIGEDHDPETHLIPLVLFAALGIRPNVTIFGQDYDTPDGTCLRDYIHVCDLANAHLAALNYLVGGGPSGSFNLGTGIAHSVREIIDVAERVTGREIPVIHGQRRPGDPAVLVASPEKAQRMLPWTAQRSSLEDIVRDAWQWHERRHGV